MELRVLLLGTVMLEAGSEHRPLGSPKEQLVLAALAWDAGRAVSVDELVYRVWDDTPPARPRDSLYTYMTRIRGALGALAGRAAPTLTNQAGSYLLDADPDRVDLRRYLTLLDRGRSLTEGNSDLQALDVLAEAHRLRRGEPLSGLPGGWAAEVRELVAERTLAAELTAAEASIRLGRCAETAARLRPLAERHPTHTQLVKLLALALHGSGRTTQAAQVIGTTQHRLVREWGTDRDAELDRVLQGTLSNSPAAALLRPAGAHPSGTPGIDTLPPDVKWVGRRDEVRRLIGLAGGGVHGGAVVAVSGMPGSGKTTLAVHVAHQVRDAFPDGRFVVDLRAHASLQPPMTQVEALRNLLRLLGVPAEDIPTESDELTSRWRALARSRRFVAVLDDAAGPDQVEALLPGESSALILVTSRHRMTALPGVHSLALDELSRQDAVDLLRQLLTGQTIGTRDAQALARMCGHLPLAIAITAGRLRSRPSWRAAELITSLGRSSRRLPQIRDGRRELAHAFEQSYLALTPRQQLVFRRIGLHFGLEFGPEAAAALSGRPLEETDRTLEELLHRNLVSESAPHRYRMHDLVREYAESVARRDPGDDNKNALERLVRYYLESADLVDRRVYPHRLRITGPRSPQPADGPRIGHLPVDEWFTVEGPSLLAALTHTQAHGSPRQLALMAHALTGFLESEGYLRTAGPVLRQAVAYWEGAHEPRSLGRALIDLTSVSTRTGNFGESIRTAERALVLARATGDEALEAESLHQLAIAYWNTARVDTALSMEQSCLRLRLRGDDRIQQARSFNILGMLSLLKDRPKESLKYFLESLSRFRDEKDRRGEIILLNNLAELYVKVGSPQNAAAVYRQAIELSQQAGNRDHIPVLQTNLANTLLALGKPQEALALLQTALPSLRSAGERRSEAIARHAIGRALHATGRSEEALPHHTTALAIARSIQARMEECQALLGLGEAELATGRHARGEAHLRDALAVSREIEARDEETAILHILRQLPGPEEHG